MQLVAGFVEGGDDLAALRIEHPLEAIEVELGPRQLPQHRIRPGQEVRYPRDVAPVTPPECLASPIEMAGTLFDLDLVEGLQILGPLVICR